MEPKQKQHPIVDVTGDGSKGGCCEKQFGQYLSLVTAALEDGKWANKQDKGLKLKTFYH